MTTQFAQISPFSTLPPHYEDDITNESFSVESASQALQVHSCSRTCGRDSRDVEDGQISKSQAKRTSKLFPEIGQAFQKIRRLSTTAQSHRFVLWFSIRLVLTLISEALILSSTNKIQRLLSSLDLFAGLARSRRCSQLVLQVLSV